MLVRSGADAEWVQATPHPACSSLRADTIKIPVIPGRAARARESGYRREPGIHAGPVTSRHGSRIARFALVRDDGFISPACGGRESAAQRREGIAQLVERLADTRVSEKEVNIRNKLSRGKFSAAFILVCLEAIGTGNLRL